MIKKESGLPEINHNMEGHMSKYPEKKVKNQWYKKVCDSVMARNELLSKVWAYEYGVIWNGMEGVWRFT